MYQKIKAEIELLFGLLLITIALTLLYMLVGSRGKPLITAALGAPTYQPCVTSTNVEALAAFGLSAEAIQISKAAAFDLAVDITPKNITVSPGNNIELTVSIENPSSNPAPFIFFCDDLPAGISNVNYAFNISGVVSDGQADPTWLLPSIAAGSTAEVTVTGTIDTDCDLTVSYIAYASPFEVTADSNTSNNVSSSDINITGQGSCGTTMYLPLVIREPTPTPLPKILAYFEDFNDGEPWLEFNNDGCETNNTNGQFWVDLERSDRICLPPAKDENNPERPYRTYGEFQVDAYHSEGESNAAYGIFINGQGGDDYYYFRIFPNNGCSIGGDWQLKRRRDNDEETLLSGSCHPAIKRGFQQATSTNVLKIVHTNDRRLTVFVNGTQLGAFVDSPGKHLTHIATGVYVRSDDEDIRIKFDNFKVYKFP